MRICQLVLNEQIDAFELYQEMASFSFPNRKEMIDFLDNLPHLNAFEMLMLLNPINEIPENKGNKH